MLYLINGYKTSVPLFQSLSGLSWWAWVSKDLPLAKSLHDAMPVPCRYIPGNHDSDLSLVAELLGASSDLRILVTSRSRLDVYGEQEFPVTQLQLDAAIELFVQRAAAVWPGFVISSENESAIREIA